MTCTDQFRSHAHHQLCSVLLIGVYCDFSPGCFAYKLCFVDCSMFYPMQAVPQQNRSCQITSELLIVESNKYCRVKHNQNLMERPPRVSEVKATGSEFGTASLVPSANSIKPDRPSLSESAVGSPTKTWESLALGLPWVRVLTRQFCGSAGLVAGEGLISTRLRPAPLAASGQGGRRHR